MIDELGWRTLEERSRVDRLCNFNRTLEGIGGWRELRGKVVREVNHYGRRDHERKGFVKGRGQTWESSLF